MDIWSGRGGWSGTGTTREGGVKDKRRDVSGVGRGRDISFSPRAVSSSFAKKSSLIQTNSWVRGLDLWSWAAISSALLPDLIGSLSAAYFNSRPRKRNESLRLQKIIITDLSTTVRLHYRSASLILGPRKATSALLLCLHVARESCYSSTSNQTPDIPLPPPPPSPTTLLSFTPYLLPPFTSHP